MANILITPSGGVASRQADYSPIETFECSNCHRQFAILATSGETPPSATVLAKAHERVKDSCGSHPGADLLPY